MKVTPELINRGGALHGGAIMALHRGRRAMVWQTTISRGDDKLAALVTQTQLDIPAAED